MGSTHEAGPMDRMGDPLDDFDTPDDVDGLAPAAPVRNDPMRPSPVNGRYRLPHPGTGKSMTWQRVTNFIKLVEDTYHLELWKQRNVAKGIAMRPDYVDAIQRLDVKRDRDKLNKLCERAQELAGAYKLADEGTAIHKSAELVDFAGGDVSQAPGRHLGYVQLYRDALRTAGLSVVPDMIERVAVSVRYQTAGKFDRIYRMADGSYVMADLKTGDSIDLSLPSIACQLKCYEDAVNTHGIWDGTRYDDSIKVRNDFALVVHLPSTRPGEISILKVSLAKGAVLNGVALEVREGRKIKAKHVAEPFLGVEDAQSDPNAEWMREVNWAASVEELLSIADRARAVRAWDERLADLARERARGPLSEAYRLRNLNSGTGS